MKINIRTIFQLFFVSLTAFLALAHQKYGIEKVASIDAYCPFGGVESFFTLLLSGQFLNRTYWSSLILLGVFVLATLLLGRIFCSYFCPLGAAQEWLRNIGRKFVKKDIEVPEQFDKYLRFAKYIVLIVVVYYSFYLGDLIFRNYDPYNAAMHFGGEYEEKFVAYWILALVLVAALFSKNLWCRYFCPLGAFFGIVKKFSFLKLARDKKTCISCGICDATCPANLNVKNAKVVDSPDCISCGNCVSKCPKTSLQFSLFGKKLTNNIIALSVLLVSLIIFGISNTPYWQTKPATNLIKSDGQIDVANIRGSNTLGNLIETTKIPLEEFVAEFGLPKDIDLTTKLKEISTTYNITNPDGSPLETTDFREFVTKKTSILK